MEDYPSNSHKKKTAPSKAVEEPKKVERIVEGEVIRRKKPLGKRFAEIFIGGDAKSVGNYVLFEVLLPAVKDTLADAMSQGVERMLFGEARSTSRRTGRRPGGYYDNSYISYNRPPNRATNVPGSYGRHDESRAVSRRSRATHDFDEIILSTRVEAEEVIDSLFDLVSKFESASVSDLYELVGVSGSFVDEKWGWTDLRGASVSRIRNGYLLNLPKPEPLD